MRGVLARKRDAATNSIAIAGSGVQFGVPWQHMLSASKVLSSRCYRLTCCRVQCLASIYGHLEREACRLRHIRSGPIAIYSRTNTTRQ